MKKKFILAVVGLPGSGKSEAVKYLVKLGWQRVYFGEVTFDELKRRKTQVNEKNERRVREWFRRKYGMGAYAILNLPRMQEALKQGPVVAESLYSWEEYKIVKDKYGKRFKVLAIFAPFSLRAKRLQHRKVRPHPAKELLSRDYAQIENINIAGPIAEADFTIINVGSLSYLYQEIDKVLKSLK